MRFIVVSILAVGITCAGNAQIAPTTVPLLNDSGASPHKDPNESAGQIKLPKWQTDNAKFRPTIYVDTPTESGQKDAVLSAAMTQSSLLWQMDETRTNNSNTGTGTVEDYGLNSDREESAGTGFKSSSSVPLDSWIYAAFDRLEAMGYFYTGSESIRPWTRLECARLLAEAHTNVDQGDEAPAALLAALDKELEHETSVIDGTVNTSAKLESAYARFTGITGTPLRDSFHFGQTLADDYGRPYGKGGNAISGASVQAEYGMFSIYMRGEYQYASAMPTYNATAQQTLAGYDGLPFGWNLRAGTTDRVRMLEAYVAMNVANWQLSFGQQALWWGPDRSTSLMLSNNSEAMPMLRLARVKPIKIPGILAWVGPLHVEAFMSREDGIHYVHLGPNYTTLYGNPSQGLNPPPYMWGATISIKPTENFELGFGHTVIFAGYGRPLNFKTFFHTFSVDGNGQAIDPGKRVTEFNLSYHLPGMRKSAILYSELMAWDDPIQGKFLARYAMDPGIYIPKVPGIKRLDLRAEGVYTDLPKLTYQAYFYSNARYAQGYTNYGQIIGSWIGRQGDGGQASSTYWFSARNKATVSYRKMSADKSFLQGGNLSDISGSVSWMVHQDVELSANFQYEQQKFPLLSSTGQSNFTTSLGIKLHPKAHIGSR